ncbi:MAG: HigA family addiction module antidote protein [Candidatus Moeniiplasma glomeromycotorum]|nr:HigA family addiction module antidote protein [Candidatus Moeniiplasma glomeromycotorum]MCE8167963.1 HigA family addiction module antidote protein [Candidatus Moeniiplasma glomeromycotorum]MCE8169202.1 HigA family addiction module antidote protein [Candidatus Moeniiplasma glomeromycotorum]
MARDERLKPIHPGEILREELLIPLNISGEKLAQELKIEKEIVAEIIAEKRNIIPEIALRLSLYFPQSAQFWLNCQRDYENDCLEEIEKSDIEELKRQIHSYSEIKEKKNIKVNNNK